MLNGLDATDPSVKAAADAAAKVTVVTAILAKRSGTKPAAPGNSGKNDISKNGVDWDTVDSLPRNRAIDDTEAAFS